MLTSETLKANAALASLTDEQIAAITTLSTNDENDVIAKKTGEIYGKLDADILASSGVAKNGTEKTYDYAKRVISELFGKAGQLEQKDGEIAHLTKEAARLQKVIDEGGADKETAKQLKQAKADFANITNQYNALNEKYNAAEAEHAKQLLNMRIDGEISKGAGTLKFKSGFTDGVKRVIMQQVTDKVRNMNPEYITTDGGQMLVFKNTDGSIMRNSNNLQNPYTAAELIEKELKAMDVLEVKTPGGGGTNPPKPGEGSILVDIAGARTQTEAYDVIKKSLMAQGMTTGSPQFQEAMDKAWKDNNIMSLPER